MQRQRQFRAHSRRAITQIDIEQTWHSGILAIRQRVCRCLKKHKKQFRQLRIPNHENKLRATLDSTPNSCIICFQSLALAQKGKHECLQIFLWQILSFWDAWWIEITQHIQMVRYGRFLGNIKQEKSTTYKYHNWMSSLIDAIIITFVILLHIIRGVFSMALSFWY